MEEKKEGKEEGEEKKRKKGKEKKKLLIDLAIYKTPLCHLSISLFRHTETTAELSLIYDVH